MGNVEARGTISSSPVGTGVGVDVEISTLLHGGTSTTAVAKSGTNTVVGLGLVLNATGYVDGGTANTLSREQASAIVSDNSNATPQQDGYTNVTGGSQTVAGRHSESLLIQVTAGKRWGPFSPLLVGAVGASNVCMNTKNTITENVYESVPPAGTPALPNDRNAMSANQARPGSNVKVQKTDYPSSSCSVAPHLRAGVQVNLQPWKSVALSVQSGYQNLGGHGGYLTAGVRVLGDWDLALAGASPSVPPNPAPAAPPPAPPAPPAAEAPKLCKTKLKGNIKPSDMLESNVECKPCTINPAQKEFWYGDSSCVEPGPVVPPPTPGQAKCTLKGAPNDMPKKDLNCKPCNDTKAGKKIFKDSAACKALNAANPPVAPPPIPPVITSTAASIMDIVVGD